MVAGNPTVAVNWFKHSNNPNICKGTVVYT